MTQFLRKAILVTKVEEDKILRYKNSTEFMVHGWNDETYLTQKINLYGRMLLMLGEYLVRSGKFDSFSYHITNDTYAGIIESINRSEVDVGVNEYVMNRTRLETVDLSYPYRLYSYTFMIHKPEYKPQIFGILHAFSCSVWIVFFCVLILMLFAYHVTFKWKYSSSDITLDVFAVFLGQNSILRPSSMHEKLVIWSWVAGTTFIGLAYNSGFLSFLAIPPVSQVRDVAELARAVQKGEYRCIAIGYKKTLSQSKLENLRIIGRDLVENNLSHKDVIDDFFQGRRNDQNLAFLGYRLTIDVFTVRDMFVSDDRFLESLSVMVVRKDFCCKKLLETFVHIDREPAAKSVTHLTKIFSTLNSMYTFGEIKICTSANHICLEFKMAPSEKL